MYLENGTKKSILILYYSGVGGTRVIVDVLAAMLGLYIEVETRGVDSDFVINMSNSDLQVYLLKFDMLIFACPVYRMMPPKPMVAFVERLETFDRPVKAYIFMTKSGISGDAALGLIEMLEEKNIIVGGFAELIAPGTDLNVVVKKKEKEGDDFGLFRNFATSVFDTLRGGKGALDLVRSMAKDIRRIISTDRIEPKRPKPKKSMFFWWWLQVNYLDVTEERLHQIKFRKECKDCTKCVVWKCTQNAWVEKYGQPFFVRENCIGCQMCVNLCPHSIVISTQQEKSRTEDYPRLSRGFYRKARERFFKVGSK